MKKSFLLFCALLLSFSLFAQSNRSSLRLRLSDGTPLKVVINNRDFDKIGTALIIGDIPGKRPHIIVYRFRPYADGKGGKAELVYSGTIKVKRGSNYDAIVDVNNKKLFMKEVSTLSNVPSQPPVDPYRPQIIQDNQNVMDISNEQTTSDLSPQLQTIQKAMDEVTTDNEKLKVANRYIGDKISTADVAQISNWFFFDDTKMQFIKVVYPKIYDKEKAVQLKDIFISDSSKKELADFLKKGK